MNNSPRVAIFGIAHESNTFAEGVTTLELFQRDSILVGPDILSQRGRGSIAGGFISVLDDAGVEVVPILLTATTPGPVVADEALRRMWSSAEEQFRRCGKLDGVLFALHGAGVSEVERDMDGWLLSRVREIVGPSVPIMGTIDPHANVSKRMLAAADVLLPYKRNPHTDAHKRSLIVAELMVGKLRGKIHPVQAYCLPPMVMNIEKQHTESEPLLSFVRMCEAAEKESGIIDASVLMGFHYADVEEMTSSVQVIADGDAKLARDTALRIGRSLWERADEFLPDLIDSDKAIDLATAKTTPKPVCLLDMGDNVGGGGSARGTWILDALSRKKGIRAFLMMMDVAAVEAACAAGEGAAVDLVLGGSDRREWDGPSVGFIGRVERLPGESFDDPTPRHGTGGTYHLGKCALLRSDDGNLVVLAIDRRAALRSRMLFDHCGLKLEDFDVILAKGVNAPVAAFDGRCPTFIRVNTPGATAVQLDLFEFKHRRYPLFPFERNFSSDWDGLLVMTHSTQLP